MLLNHLWPARRLTTVALVLWIIAGLGKIVGAVPENMNFGLHLLGGLNLSVLSSAGQYAGSSLYLGFGVGGMERSAGYPSNL